MTEENTIEIEILGEELGLLVAEDRVRELDTLLEDLPHLRGSHFIWQLKEIAAHPSFTLVKGEENIYSTGGEGGDDYDNLLNAARKAVDHGYRVFILPNPQGFRTADFIFERKGVYKMFDLKTIQGKNSVGNRLKESIGQTDCVLLNMTTNYRAISLASCIKKYFEINPSAMEILVFKSNKAILVKRCSTESKNFFKTFTKKYNK